ncbi:MAG: hypothetical protein HY722_10185 [Planctomycetes bacterium]|nr:hypothetical protein [Planctomycetota bacterium]
MRGRGVRGVALIMVVAVVAAIVAIAAPFLVSMRLAERSAQGHAETTRARLASEATCAMAAGRLTLGHEALDPDPLVDGYAEVAGPLGLDLEALEEVLGPGGATLGLEWRDLQGALDPNTASGRVLGNFIAATELAADCGADDATLRVRDTADFYTDGDPRTLDGLVEVDGEFIAYAHADSGLLAGCRRAQFFTALRRRDRVHPAGAIVRDGRGYKLAAHRLWARPGLHTPFRNHTDLRSIALWEFTAYRLALLFSRGLSRGQLGAYGVDLAGLEGVLGAPPRGDEGPSDSRADALLRRRGVDPAMVRRVGGERAARRVAGLAETLDEAERLPEDRREEAMARVQEQLAAVAARLDEADRDYRETLPAAAASARALAALRERGLDIEILGADEVEGWLREVSVEGWRSADWTPPVPNAGRVKTGKDDETTWIPLVDARGFREGAVARLEAAGAVEFRAVADVRLDGVALWPTLSRDLDPWEARLSAQVPRAVNLNTASERTLRAVVLGLGGGWADQGGRPVPRFVTVSEAGAFARAVVDREAPLAGVGDLRALLADLVRDRVLEDWKADLILLALMHPDSPAGAPPAAFRAGGTWRLGAQASVRAPSGVALARHFLREEVDLTPPLAEVPWTLSRQSDFAASFASQALRAGAQGDVAVDGRIEEALRQNGALVPVDGRRSSLLVSGPVPHLLSAWGEPSTAEGQGWLRLASSRTPALQGTVYLAHHDREPEGRRVDGAGLQFDAASLLPREGSALAPGHLECWFRPDAVSGARTLLDCGEGDNVNRLAIQYQGGALRLTVADEALDVAESTALGVPPRAQTLSAPVALEPGRWYHLAAAWRGSGYGDLSLAVDGRVLGDHEHYTWLSGVVDRQPAPASLTPSGVPGISHQRIALESTRGLPPQGGVLRLGAGDSHEVVEYDRVEASAVLARVRDYAPSQYLDATPEEAAGRTGVRAARGTSERDHSTGTVVTEWGYTSALPQDAPAGETQLYHDLTERFLAGDSYFYIGADPATLGGPLPPPVVPATATDIPIVLPTGTPGAYLPPSGILAVWGGFDLAVLRFRMEYIHYRGVSGNLLTGCTRGVLIQGAPGSAWGGPGGWAPIAYDPFDLPYGSNAMVQSLAVLDPAAVPPSSAWAGHLSSLSTGFDRLPFWGEPRFVTVRNAGDRRDEWFAYASPADPALQRYLIVLSRVPRQPGDPAAPPPSTLHAYAAGTPVLQVLRLGDLDAGEGDWVTVTDDGGGPGEERQIDRAATVELAEPVWDMVASPGSPIGFNRRGELRYAALDAALARPYVAASGARLVKFPSGALPTRLPSEAWLGRLRPPPAPAPAGGPGGGGSAATASASPGEPFPGTLDELRVTRDLASEAMAAALNLGAISAQLRAVLPPAIASTLDTDLSFLGADLDTTQTQIPLLAPQGTLPPPLAALLDQLVQAAGLAGLFPTSGVIRIDGECMGYARVEGARMVGCVRGLLGTTPARHARESAVYLLPATPFAVLAGEVDRAEVALSHTAGFPPEGHVLFDPGAGAWAAGEVMAYRGLDAAGLVRCTDRFSVPTYRGSFGTTRSAHAAGAAVVAIPFRHYDRFDAAVQGPDEAAFEARTTVREAWWLDARWQGVEPPGTLIDVRLRLDGRPEWVSSPGPYRAGRPAGPNPMGRRADLCEVRVGLGYRPGAFAAGLWKDTPVLRRVEVLYHRPSRTISREEWRE